MSETAVEKGRGEIEDLLPWYANGRLSVEDRRRVEAALAAVGPRLRPMLNRICIHGDSLQLAETGLGLRRRQGKTVLKQALQALADHYGIG